MMIRRELPIGRHLLSDPTFADLDALDEQPTHYIVPSLRLLAVDKKTSSVESIMQSVVRQVNRQSADDQIPEWFIFGGVCFHREKDPHWADGLEMTTEEQDAASKMLFDYFGPALGLTSGGPRPASHS